MIKNIEITDELKNQFNSQGYLILPEFLNRGIISGLTKKFDNLFLGNFETGIEPDEWNWKKGRDPENITRQICNAWKSDNNIKEIVCHEILGKACAQLMNWSGARLLQDNVLWKPPGGKTLAYHQDAAYDDWIVPQTMMTCWIPLDDVSQEKGTLEFVKGSHKWGLSPPKGQFHFPDDYKKELNLFAKKKNKNLEIQYVNIPAGGVSFHHGFTWHGSGVNITSQDRRAIVAHCVPSNSEFHPTNVGGTAKIYKKYKKIDSNDLDESFFPILWTKEGKRTNV
tara:strand:+ start:125 stop:967 length:843 start_codon:yes stop_codon:yes gene_type:complete